jgi:transposase
VPEDDIHALARLQPQINRLVFEAGGAYGEAPSQLVRAQMADLYAQEADVLRKYNDALKSDIAEYNRAAETAGAPTVFGGSAITVEPVK